MIFVTIFIAGTLLFDFVYAQNSAKTESESNYWIRKLSEFDLQLTPTVSGSLAGLSMAAASFLTRSANGEHEEYARHIRTAKKRFVMAFTILITCTVSILVFDFLEILWETSLAIVVIDTVLTYGLFGIGLAALVGGYSEVYRSERR